MVAQQILVLLVQVRALVEQQKKSCIISMVRLFFYTQWLVGFLIIESEMPKRYRVGKSKLDIIFYNKRIRESFNLLVSFFTSSNFKRITFYAEIRSGRGDDILVYPHLVKEKGFADIPDLAVFACQAID